MSQANTISIFVKSQFPDNFNVDGAQLVKFIEYYYEWLEQYENPVYVARKLQEYADVDFIPDKFFDFIRDEFMKNIPTQNVVDDRLLVKHIKDFYRAKGTEKSFRLLFRILFNDDIDFYYPGEDILRASDGRWVVERSVIVNSLVSDFTPFVSVKGENSVATAKIDRVATYIQSSVEITEVYLTSIFGTFQQNEYLIDTISGDKIAYVTSNGVTTYPGSWAGTKGWLSWDKYLQDNFYYQEFSYVLKTSNPVNNYRDIVEKLVHPAGTKLFGSILIIPDLNQGQFSNVASLTSLSAGGGSLDLGVGVESILGFAAVDVGTSGVFVFELIVDSYPTPFSANSYISVASSANGAGTLSVLNSQLITFYASNTISELRGLELSHFSGAAKIVYGTGTDFEPSVTSGDALDIYNSNGTFQTIISKVSSDRWLALKDAHTYGTVTAKTYKYYSIA